jgi:hypothetical protein
MARYDRYVPVPSEDIIGLLESKGFTRVHGLTTKRGRPVSEVVYERAHNDNPAVKVRVFTSITTGRTRVRNCDRDAIKVATVVVGRQKTYGVGKFPRILRTGSVEAVLERMLERMRLAYARGTEWIREQTIKDVMLA